jgi:UDP-N-acetylenolpyruvoylglucosamine reductase
LFGIKPNLDITNPPLLPNATSDNLDKDELLLTKEREEITEILVNGRILTDKNDIAEAFKVHFETCAETLANSLPKDLIFTRVFFKAKNKEDINKIKQKMDEISAIRSSSQPVSEKTGGSTFANPEGFRAWELIDKAGLRKTRVGGACMSEMHCNFMINDNNATATDMENLGELIRQKVKENSGIELQWEIKRIGKL